MKKTEVKTKTQESKQMSVQELRKVLFYVRDQDLKLNNEMTITKLISFLIDNNEIPEHIL